MNDTCENCRYWVKGVRRWDEATKRFVMDATDESEGPAGECRKQAPSTDGGDFPRTYDIDRCGDWQARQ